MHLLLASSLESTAQQIGKQLRPEDLELGLFVTTASEGEEGDKSWLEDDRQAALKAGFKLNEYTFTGKTADQIETAVRGASALIIEGGNTFYLLDAMRQTGADKIITQAVASGKCYIGSSAGTIVAGSTIEQVKGSDDLQKAPGLKSFEGLNLVDLAFWVHWGGETGELRQKDLRSIADFYEKDLKFCLLRNNQYLHATDAGYKLEG